MNTTGNQRVAMHAFFRWGVAVIGAACLCVSAGAQINRSRPSTPPASGGSPSGGSSTSDGSRNSRNSGSSSSSSDSGRTPRESARTPGVFGGNGGRSDSSSDSGATGSARGGQKSLDRYNRSQEGAGAKNQSGSSHAHYIPGIPIFLFPYGYIPYYPYPDPGRDPYPQRRDRSSLAARYDSPYFYCDDLVGGQYVNGAAVIIAKPKRLYTPTPVYKDGDLISWRDLGANDYLADRNAETTDYRVGEGSSADPALDAAISDIRQSWLDGKIEPLARHLSKELIVAVVLAGKYIYSLESGDFLEATRAAYDSGSGLRFVADHIRMRTVGVYALTGRHLYTDNRNKERAVYFTYVLAKVKGEYILTQIAAAPDHD